ncbi:MAG TPA: gamma-glutamyltransferase [Acidimicrobiia bacterium]
MRRVSIAAGSHLAADAGAAIADDGGNAVDATVAAVLVSMCTDPGIIAPGAGGFLTIWPQGADPVVIDAYAEMPGRGLGHERRGTGGREVWLEYGGGLHTVVGPGSVAVPGALAGLALAVERFGRLPWSAVVEPAIEAVAAGFPLSAAAGAYLAYSHDSIFGWDPASREVLHHSDGTPLGEGDIVNIPDLVDTLRAIAYEGVDVLYRGDLGRHIAAAVQEGDGLLTVEDLAGYRPEVRRPLLAAVDTWMAATNPPPAVGGACLAAMLLLLDDHPFATWSADEVEHLARVQRAVLTYRRRRLDPAASDREREAAALLDMARVGDLEGVLTAPSTVHTSGVDTDGLGCSVTVSAGYGSGMMVQGTGFWLNNSLGEMELHPDGFHHPLAGTRLVSNMAPTVARSSDGVILAIGSAGADRITTAITTVLLNFIHLGMSLREAVAHPRVHVETFDGTPRIAHEPGLPVGAFDDLVPRRFPDMSMYFGGVQAALWDPVAGLYEAADPRRTGGTARGGAAPTASP